MIIFDALIGVGYRFKNRHTKTHGGSNPTAEPDGFFYCLKVMYNLYVLINENTPIYVGVSANVRQRMNTHRSKGKVFTRHVILEKFTDKKMAYTAERAIIKYLSAFGNSENVNGKYQHIEYNELRIKLYSNG